MTAPTLTSEQRARLWSSLGFGAPTPAEIEAKVAVMVADAAHKAEAKANRTWSEATLGGNGVTEPMCTPTDAQEFIQKLMTESQEHWETCSVWCDECEQFERPHSCPRCKGSGNLPNAAMAYLECGDCAGEGREHKAWDDRTAVLVAERDALAKELADLRGAVEAWIRHGEAVPADVTTYDREIVNSELRALLNASSNP